MTKHELCDHIQKEIQKGFSISDTGVILVQIDRGIDYPIEWVEYTREQWENGNIPISMARAVCAQKKIDADTAAIIRYFGELLARYDEEKDAIRKEEIADEIDVFWDEGKGKDRWIEYVDTDDKDKLRRTKEGDCYWNTVVVPF